MGFTPTREEIRKELLLCGKSPAFFIENYCKINHPLKGLIPFKLFPFQRQLATDFKTHRFNIVLKARQLGISTLAAAYIAHLMLFYRSKTVLVLATKMKTSANLVKKVKLVFKHLPEWMMIAKPKTDNATSFELDNGSIITASAKSSDAGRSEALSLLCIDESAHVEGLDEMWAAVYPTLSVGGACMLLSSPNGQGNLYHRIWVESEAGHNEFFRTKLPWYVHPERDQTWFDKETKSMKRSDIAQELLCDFVASGASVFDPADMARLELGLSEPITRTGMDRNFWIWEVYNPASSYLLVSDVARGDGKDFSVFHIFNLNTMEIVAEYQGRLTPDFFSQVILSAAHEYGNCLVVVENNTVGFAVLQKLIDAKYPNIYYSTKGDHEYIDQYEADQLGNSAVAGFSTTSKTRPLIVAKAEEYIRNDKVKIHSSRLLNEMKTFIWENGKAQAMRGYCDDLVMALAIGCWVRDTALSANAKDVAYKKVFLECATKMVQRIDHSVVGEPGHMMPTKKEVENQIKNNAKGDYMWIYKG